DERLRWETLESSAEDFKGYADWLIREAERGRQTVGESLWLQSLHTATDDLGESISFHNSTLLRKAANKIHQIIGSEPSQINNCMFAQLQSLTRVQMAKKLITLRDRLNQVQLSLSAKQQL